MASTAQLSRLDPDDLVGSPKEEAGKASHLDYTPKPPPNEGLKLPWRIEESTLKILTTPARPHLADEDALTPANLGRQSSILDDTSLQLGTREIHGPGWGRRRDCRPGARGLSMSPRNLSTQPQQHHRKEASLPQHHELPQTQALYKQAGRRRSVSLQDLRTQEFSPFSLSEQLQVTTQEVSPAGTPSPSPRLQQTRMGSDAMQDWLDCDTSGDDDDDDDDDDEGLAKGEGAEEEEGGSIALPEEIMMWLNDSSSEVDDADDVDDENDDEVEVRQALSRGFSWLDEESDNSEEEAELEGERSNKCYEELSTFGSFHSYLRTDSFSSNAMSSACPSPVLVNKANGLKICITSPSGILANRRPGSFGDGNGSEGSSPEAFIPSGLKSHLNAPRLRGGVRSSSKLRVTSPGNKSPQGQRDTPLSSLLTPRVNGVGGQAWRKKRTPMALQTDEAASPRGVPALEDMATTPCSGQPHLVPKWRRGFSGTGRSFGRGDGDAGGKKGRDRSIEMRPPQLSKYKSLILDTGVAISKDFNPALRNTKCLGGQGSPHTSPLKRKSSPMNSDDGGYSTLSSEMDSDVEDFLDEFPDNSDTESCFRVDEDEDEVAEKAQVVDELFEALSLEDRTYLEQHAELREVLLSTKDLRFGELSYQHQILLMRDLKHVSYKKGEVIIAEGDDSDKFYIMVGGSPGQDQTEACVVVSKAMPDGEDKEICRLHAGQYFGERALVYGQASSRSANVTAASDGVRCVYVESTTFEAWTEFRMFLLMKEVPLLAKLPTSALVAIQKTLHYVDFPPNTFIVNEGDVGDKFYMITKGSVEVLALRSDEHGNQTQKVLVQMYEGHYFGELALIYDEPRNASVRSLTSVSCIYITKDDFHSCLAEKNFQHVLQEVAYQRIGYMEKREAREKANMDRRLEPVKRSVTGEDAHETGGEFRRGDSFIETIKLVKRRMENGMKIINKYQIVAEIGKGAYGTVHLCRDMETNKQYAMKVMNKKKRGKCAEQTTRSLRREVAAMKKLRHPNIVTLWEVIDDPRAQQMYMIQDFVERGPVLEEREKVSPLDPDVAREKFVDCVRGLHYLHEHDIIHGDIKPANLLETAQGQIKIADFGAAVVKSMEGMVPEEDIAMQKLVGTPAFMAPELFGDQGISRISPASDVWALGVTLYQMVTGSLPFWSPSGNHVDLEYMVRHGEATFPLDTGAFLINLIRRILDKSPSQRITLPQIIEHPWVTLEGSLPREPLGFEGPGVLTNPGAVTDGELEDALTMFGNSPSKGLRGRSSPSPQASPALSQAKKLGTPSMLPPPPLLGTNKAKCFFGCDPSADPISGRHGGARKPRHRSKHSAEAAATPARPVNPSAPSGWDATPEAAQASEGSSCSLASSVPCSAKAGGAGDGSCGRLGTVIKKNLRGAFMDSPTGDAREAYQHSSSVSPDTEAQMLRRQDAQCGSRSVTGSTGCERAEMDSNNVLMRRLVQSHSFDSGNTKRRSGRRRELEHFKSTLVQLVGSHDSLSPDTIHLMVENRAAALSSAISSATEITIEVEGPPASHKPRPANLSMGGSESTSSPSWTSVGSPAEVASWGCTSEMDSPVGDNTIQLTGTDPHLLSRFASSGSLPGRTSGAWMTTQDGGDITTASGARRVHSDNSFAPPTASGGIASSRPAITREEVGEEEAAARRRGLARKGDFLLVPTTLTSDSQGNVTKRAVLFQAKNNSRTFSLLRATASTDAFSKQRSQTFGYDTKERPPLSLRQRQSFPASPPVAESPRSRSLSMGKPRGGRSFFGENFQEPTTPELVDGETEGTGGMKRILEGAHLPGNCSSTEEDTDGGEDDEADYASDDTESSYSSSDSDEEGWDNVETVSTADDLDLVIPDVEVQSNCNYAGMEELAEGEIGVVQARTWGQQSNLELGLRFGHYSDKGKRDTMEDRTKVVSDLFSEAPALVPLTSDAMSRVGGAPLARFRTEPTRGRGASGTSVGRAVPGGRSESVSSDSDEASPAAFFGVYDGHSGHDVASALQDTLHMVLRRQSCFVKDLPLAIENACYEVDMACLQRDQDRRTAGRDEPKEDGKHDPLQRAEEFMFAGAAAIMAVVRDDPCSDAVELYTANVGDCRAIICRAGVAVELSQDHKPTREDEQARIEAAGGYISRGRLNGLLGVTRAFGDITFKVFPPDVDGGLWQDQQLIAKPEIAVTKLVPEDEFFILACDGIWDAMTSQQAVNYVQRRLRAHHDVQRASRELVYKAIELKSIDNCSCVVVCLNQQEKIAPFGRSLTVPL